jgi:hypothetical protein
MSKRSRSTQPAGSTAPPNAASRPPASPKPVAAPPPRPTAGATPGGVASTGRRTRAAATTPRSPLERYRGAIIGAAVVAVVAVAGAFLFLGASQPVYACETVLQPAPAAAPAPDATPRLGQVTRDLGRDHVETGERVRYELCPPTSGPHYNDSRFGPIATRFYGADDRTNPQGWIHNLEHGQMTVLYRCPEGCDEEAQAALRTLQQQLPASPLCSFPSTSSVVVTRFDDLPTPYAAVAWGRALFLDSLDHDAIATFSAQSADRGPEPQCQAAVPSAGPSAVPSPTPAP